jgi:hypothetical protein
VFNYLAAPLSEQAHFVEQLRLVAPGRIEGEMTITDPVTLARPWTVHFAFVPAGIDRLVYEGDPLLDRNRVEGDTVTIAPPSEDPLSEGRAAARGSAEPRRARSARRPIRLRRPAGACP